MEGFIVPFAHKGRHIALTTAIAALFSLQGLAGATPARAQYTYTPAQVAGMKFGYSTPTDGSLSTGQAVDRQISIYGAGVVRRYYSGFPAGWSTIDSQGHGLPTFVSFKVSPQSVNSGQYDAAFTAWFKAAPRDRRSWWSFMPEPEDDIARGTYTAAQFRSAYSRLAGLSRMGGNPQLTSTLTLMAYTAGSCGRGSTRNILDYWPGGGNVDEIAFDCSNRGVGVGQYTDPAQMLTGARDAAKQLGKPWGLGEIESQLLPGDDGRQRAAWLIGVARFVVANGGMFACYFDEKRAVDFRLIDSASKAAWRSVVIDQKP